MKKNPDSFALIGAFLLKAAGGASTSPGGRVQSKGTPEKQKQRMGAAELKRQRKRLKNLST